MFYRFDSEKKKIIEVTNEECYEPVIYKERMDMDENNFVSMVFVGISIEKKPYFEIAIKYKGTLRIIDREYYDYETAKRIFEFCKENFCKFLMKLTEESIEKQTLFNNLKISDKMTKNFKEP